MKATELMIRDWISYIPEIAEGEDSYLGEPHNIQVDLSCLQKIDELIFAPITLTAEILEKNGFHLELSSDKENVYSHFDEGDCTPIIFLSAGQEKWTLHVKNYILKKCLDFIIFHDTLYVHELQHILQLCGLDELADNFKV